MKSIHFLRFADLVWDLQHSSHVRCEYGCFVSSRFRSYYRYRLGFWWRSGRSALCPYPQRLGLAACHSSSGSCWSRSNRILDDDSDWTWSLVQYLLHHSPERNRSRHQGGALLRCPWFPAGDAYFQFSHLFEETVRFQTDRCSPSVTNCFVALRLSFSPADSWLSNLAVSTRVPITRSWSAMGWKFVRTCLQILSCSVAPPHSMAFAKYWRKKSPLWLPPPWWSTTSPHLSVWTLSG